MKPTIGIVIPTFQGAKHLSRCLPFLLHSPLKPSVLVIDSSSTDGTVDLASSMGAETMVIPQHEFNHGDTREKGRLHLKTSIVVMMTQDAYPHSVDMLEYLVAPLLKQEASLSYGRQLPHQDATLLAAFARQFNYPSSSHIRSIEDAAFYGVYTFFCSNSCAAYLNSALDEIGGFPPVLFGEDTLCAAKLLHRNHRIAYVAEAQVYHSHNYTLKDEFKRHFDMGYARSSFEHLISIAGSDSKRGKLFVRSLLRELNEKQPSLIPYALVQSFMKLCGYHFGKIYRKAFKS